LIISIYERSEDHMCVIEINTPCYYTTSYFQSM